MPDGAPNLLGILLAIGLVGMLPLAVVTMTGFLKIFIVLFLVRNALGVQPVPPKLMLYGMATALTEYVAKPLISDVTGRLQEAQIQLQTTEDVTRAGQIVREPLMQHLVRATQPEERRFFLDGANRLWPEPTRRDV